MFQNVKLHFFSLISRLRSKIVVAIYICNTRRKKAFLSALKRRKIFRAGARYCPSLNGTVRHMASQNVSRHESNARNTRSDTLTTNYARNKRPYRQSAYLSHRRPLSGPKLFVFITLGKPFRFVFHPRLYDPAGNYIVVPGWAGGRSRDVANRSAADSRDRWGVFFYTFYARTLTTARR